MPAPRVRSSVVRVFQDASGRTWYESHWCFGLRIAPRLYSAPFDHVELVAHSNARCPCIDVLPA